MIYFLDRFFLKSITYFCVYELIDEDFGKSTGHTFILLRSTHVQALGLIAVASKFVGVCHRTADWFFRKTRQLLMSARVARYYYEVMFAWFTPQSISHLVYDVRNNVFALLWRDVLIIALPDLWSLNHSKVREITWQISRVQFFSKQIITVIYIL